MTRLLRFLRAIRRNETGPPPTTAFGERLDVALAQDEGVTVRAGTLEHALESAPSGRRPRAIGASRRSKKPRRAPPPAAHA